jgi:CRISPR-associated protein Cmr2
VELGGGYALVHDGKARKLHRLMGSAFTASVGAVIAHHQAPLGRVLASLRDAEHRAKSEGGRDAFCITVIKRSGGTQHLVGKWFLDRGWSGSHMGLLLDLRNVFARDVSRRSAYILSDLLAALPPETDILESVLRHQFQRQSRQEGLDLDALCKRLGQASHERQAAGPARAGWPSQNSWLRNILLTAEFLAREGRIAKKAEKGGAS